MKFCKCQKSLFRKINFLELDEYSRNLQMLSIIEKFKNWKMKNKWKICMPFGRQNWKVGTPFGTLTCQVEKLACWDVYWHIGTKKGEVGMLLACWHVWHAWHTV